jgi:hypothetical protein
MVTQAIPPPPVATFGPGPASFQRNRRILKSASGCWANSQATSLGMFTRIIPKSANSLITPKLIIFQETFWTK